MVFRRLVKIAWRNVFRNRRRTALTLSVLVMGSAGLILIGGFFDNILEGLREQMIHSQTGHIQVSRKDFYAKGVTSPYDYLLRDSAPVKTEMYRQPYMDFVVPRVFVSAMASSDKASVAVTVVGTDAAKENMMGATKAHNADIASVHIEQGKELESEDVHGTVVGKGLLEALGLKVGDTLTVLTTREGGAIDSAQYVIRGSFVTIMKELDDRVMKVNLSSAQTLMGTPGAVHSLVGVLRRTDDTQAARDALLRTFAEKGWDLEVKTWNELMPSYGQSRDLLLKINLVVRIIMGIVFFFSISNTVNMSLMERIREFGTMMAIGNRRFTVFTTIFLEVFLLGLVGSVAGLVVGSGVAEAVSAMGIEMPPPPQGSNSYFAMINLTPALLAGTFAIAILCTLVSGVVPALRAAHFRIVVALGYV